jgi:hypothetical protein
MGFPTRSPRTSSEKKIRILKEKESLFTRGHYQQNKTFATTKSLRRLASAGEKIVNPLGTDELLASTIWIATCDQQRQKQGTGSKAEDGFRNANPHQFSKREWFHVAVPVDFTTHAL